MAEDAGAGRAQIAGREPATLEVEGLSHSSGTRQALHEVGFAIAPGSFTVLLGQNGAGKTTLFNLITRLYSNTSGSIRILGIDVRAEPARARAALGVMNFVILPMFFASSALYPLWRVRECSVLLWQICQANPFTHAVELIRSGLYGQFALLPFLVRLGCALLFLGIAILGYDPARGFIQARRP